MMTADLDQFLAGLCDEPVWFDPLFGNHGDRLIRLGAEKLLAAHEINLVDHPARARWIMVNGSGGMVEGWPGLDIIRDLSDRYPDTPLCVLPSSFLFHEPDPGRYLRGRRAPAWLWARERYSEEQLRAVDWPGEVHIGLDHDLAFRLHDDPILDPLREPGENATVLLVERDDWEGPTGRTRPMSVPGLGFIPESLRNRARRILVGPARSRQDRDSDFRRACDAFLERNCPDMAGHPIRCEDVSLQEAIDFDGFLRAVSGAACIITTRLHIGILGHLLGRRVFLVEGTYFKVRGVFEHSMGKGENHLLRWNDGQLVPSLLNELERAE